MEELLFIGEWKDQKYGKDAYSRFKIRWKAKNHPGSSQDVNQRGNLAPQRIDWYGQ